MNRLFAMILSFAMLLTAFPAVSALASPAATTTELDGADPAQVQVFSLPENQPALLNSDSYAVSDSMVNLIKQKEGFASDPYWDVAQWTVGYGTACRTVDGARCTDPYNPGEIAPRYWNMTEESATALLREEVELTYEPPVEAYLSREGLTANQHEFDALVAFTYALGAAWTYDDYMITEWLEGTSDDPSDLGLVRAMGSWCRVAGDVSGPAARRRILEAEIYLYGDYEGGSSYHPTYSYVKYNGNGSLLSGYYEDAVDYFVDGSAYGTLMVPAWDPSSTYRLPEESLTVQSAASYAALPFTDVRPYHWFYEDVSTAYLSGLMNGVTNTEFAPDQGLTRGQLVTILYRLAGSPSVAPVHGFADVPYGEFYFDPVCWASSVGIINGVTEDLFKPYGAITRQDLATILYRYEAYYLGQPNYARADMDSFLDGSDISSYAKEPMSWAVATGLITGIGSSVEPLRLAPRDVTSRAQASALLTRFQTYLDGSEDVPDDGLPHFLGWFNEYGEEITNSTIVSDHQFLDARWSE